MIRRFLFDESGQDVIEYALLASFIGLVGVVAWTTSGAEIRVTTPDGALA